MHKADLEKLHQCIEKEGFHYCFMYYSEFNEIDDKEFHELRAEYKEVTNQLSAYLFGHRRAVSRCVVCNCEAIECKIAWHEFDPDAWF